jgi:hypothetical protein
LSGIARQFSVGAILKDKRALQPPVQDDPVSPVVSFVDLNG